MKIVAWIVALITGAALSLTIAQPAQAGFFTTAVKPTIYVQESVSGVWDKPLRQAVSYVDHRTGKSHMVIGKCHQGYRCIHIKFGNPGGSLVGSEQGSTIILRRNWYGYSRNKDSRRHLIIHELGHYFGEGHNRSTHNVMYSTLFYNGHLCTTSFNTAQLNRLKGK